MVFTKNKIWFCALFLCLPSITFANITTMQSWDPVPFFNAANLNMPADTQFCYGVKKRILDENADKHRRWGINVSPFVQRAIRAQQSDNAYFGVYSTNEGDTTDTDTSLGAMSNYQGTPSLMGLFLGNGPSGNSIWGGPAAPDTGDVQGITIDTVGATGLPQNLQDAINAINNNPDPAPVTPTPPDYNNAIIYNPVTAYIPTILSQTVLEQDQISFGAFSTPLTYQKAGFRWELNFDVSDHVGFIARGGFCQITQRVIPPISLSSSSDIYNGLLTVSTYTGSSATPLAQNTFNEWVTNNIDDLLDATDGADYDITTFSDTGVEDIQLLGFFRHSFPINPQNPDEYSSMILTPYAIIGWTVPLAPVRDYSKLYALPFGNNGHTAVGGVVGITFDLIDSIEFGFEFGATGFLKKTIDQLPVPNHTLQRVIYPWREDAYYSPGFNGQFAAIFNAYEFARSTSFSLRYNYVQHNQDTITLVDPTIAPYFLPEKLEALSRWTSQMFIAALTFEIQPSVLLSVAWQGALSQKNAYCSNTIMGTLSFMF